MACGVEIPVKRITYQVCVLGQAVMQRDRQVGGLVKTKNEKLALFLESWTCYVPGCRTLASLLNICVAPFTEEIK